MEDTEFLKGKAILFITEELKGVQNDADLLESTFKNMNVIVKRHYLTTNGVDGNNNIIEDIGSFYKQETFDDCDYVIVVFMSHGLQDEQIKVGPFITKVQKQLLNPLFDIEALHGKFKWIIIQACSGKYDCHSAAPDGAARVDGQRYFLKSFASIGGTLARRYLRETGALFIQQLCANLARLKRSHDVISILRETQLPIYRRQGIIQQPRDIGNLPSRFFFNRGFVADD